MSSQLVYTADSVSLRSVKSGTSTSVATQDRQISVTGLPQNAGVIRAVISCTVSGAGAQPTALSICRINDADVTEGSASVRASVLTNRDVLISFTYQMSPYVASDQYTVTFSSITLTIDYDEGDDPGYADNEVLVPEKGVVLFAPDASRFDLGGIVLHPTACSVSEEAAGAFSLRMNHPMDPEGRWQSLLEEWIIRAPVPPYKIPEVTLPVGRIYQVKSTVTSTPLYRQLPGYTRAETAVDDTASYAAWNVHTEYHMGDYVWYTYNGTDTVFVSGGTNFGSDMSPGSQNGIWAMVGPLKPTSSNPGTGTGTYSPGVIIRDMLTLEQVTYIAVYNWKYVQIRDSLGHIGYAIADDLEETSTAADPITIPARTVYTQLFRINKVDCDEDGGTVDVRARHISYDYQANGVFDCQMTEAEPATAVALLQGRLMNDDERLIACPFETPLITADWSFGNPIQAILDPDSGLVAQLKAKLLRDNSDFFILPNTTSRIGPRLSYGVNLSGVRWGRSSDGLVTRIIPRAGDGDGGFIYLDELFIDSAHIGDYAVIRTEVLDSKYSVGQEITRADGSKRTLSRSDVIERMRQEAEDRYIVDGADRITVTLDVEFVLLGDTEEYAQYRNLQRVNLYDKILVNTGHTTAAAQVVAYDWDCLAARYNGITLGKVYSQERSRIPGYRMAKGTITYSKLSPGLIKWIRGNT